MKHPISESRRRGVQVSMNGMNGSVIVSGVEVSMVFVGGGGGWAGKLPLCGLLAPRDVLGAVPHLRFRQKDREFSPLRSTADFNLLPKTNSFGSSVPKTINKSSLSYYEEGFWTLHFIIDLWTSQKTQRLLFLINLLQPIPMLINRPNFL